MFVSHLSSFLFSLYVSASAQRKNRLARDKSFLAIPTMSWFNWKKWIVLRQDKTPSQPWPPEIMGGVWPSKCSFVPAMMMMHPRNIGVWMRDIHPLNPLKIVSPCSGGHCPSSEDDGAGRNASCGAFGGISAGVGCGRPWLCGHC